jgi:hypothetical protein
MNVQEGMLYPDGGQVWLRVAADNAMAYHPFTVASTAADPAWAHSMLLHSKGHAHSAHVRPCSPCAPRRCEQLSFTPSCDALK